MIDQVIAENNAKFCTALAAGDAAAAAAVYSDDARLLAPGSELLSGRHAIEAFWKSGIAAGIRGAELTTISLDHRDDLAVEVGLYTLPIEPNGSEPVVDHGKYVVVHQRTADRTWRWAIDIFNSDAP